MPHGSSSHFQTDSHCQDLLPDFLSYPVFKYSRARPSSFDIKQVFPPQGNICSSSEKGTLALLRVHDHQLLVPNSCLVWTLQQAVNEQIDSCPLSAPQLLDQL